MRPAHRVTAAITAAITAALLAGALAGCGPDNPDPSTESGTPTPSTSSTASDSPSPTPSPTTAEQKAYAAAEKSYRAWLAAFIEAKETFDPAKLDKSSGTPELNAAVAKEFAKFADSQKAGTTGKFSQDIKSIKGSKYVAGKSVQLAICAVTNSRFIDKNGKDITLDGPNGKPLPINTTARQNQIQFTTPDGGKTWKVNSFVQGSDTGAQC